MAATAELDRIDREILRLLMQDASRSLAEIAAEVGLTPTPCWKRVKRMEEQGVITGRVALVGPARVGLPISVFVAVETGDHSADWIARFAAAVDSLPEIVECWRLGGCGLPAARRRAGHGRLRCLLPPLPVARPEPDLNAFPHAPRLAGLRHQGTHQGRSNHEILVRSPESRL